MIRARFSACSRRPYCPALESGGRADSDFAVPVRVLTWAPGDTQRVKQVLVHILNDRIFEIQLEVGPHTVTWVFVSAQLPATVSQTACTQVLQKDTSPRH
jgi:hypothetical protein